MGGFRGTDLFDILQLTAPTFVLSLYLKLRLVMLWQPIEDLPPDWQNLASSELPPLVTVWNEQADRLRQSGEFQTFNEKLYREIAIET